MARLKAFDQDRVLDQAVDCFWARGYEATSARDRADAVGIGGARLCNSCSERIDPGAVSGHLLGVLLGIRMLVRTGAEHKPLDGVAQPALDLLGGKSL